MTIGETRIISLAVTNGVKSMRMPDRSYYNLMLEAVRRWMKDPADYFSKVEPDGINVKISSGTEQVRTTLISDFIGLREPVFVIVDDLGSELENVIVVTILLPNEY